MQRIVINACHGGFGLSDRAEALYKAYAGIAQENHFSRYEVARDDPILLQVIDQLGLDECSGGFAQLKVVEVPDGVVWDIEEYDGKEWVAEVHRTWS